MPRASERWGLGKRIWIKRDDLTGATLSGNKIRKLEFIAAYALENDYTPSSLVLDAPLVLEQGTDLKLWKPQNYGKKFYGLSTLRTGIEKSRNLMTVRIAQSLGIDKIANFSKKMNIYSPENNFLNFIKSNSTCHSSLMVLANSQLIQPGRRFGPHPRCSLMSSR